MGAWFSDESRDDYLLDPAHSREVPSESLYNYVEAPCKAKWQNETLEPSEPTILVMTYRCDVVYDARNLPSLTQLNRWTEGAGPGSDLLQTAV